MSYAGAKGITTAKTEQAFASGNNDPKNSAGRIAQQANFIRDIAQDDYGNFDLGDFQMFIVTIVAVVTYLFITYEFLASVQALATVSIRDVDTTLLSMFGLGQGAYLAKKAVGQVGRS